MRGSTKALKAAALLFSLCSVCSTVSAEDYTPSGFLGLNLYPVTTERQDTVGTLNVLLNVTPTWQYFSLTNVGRRTHAHAYDDVDVSYSEQNLRWRPLKEFPLQLTAQVVLQSGDESEIYRLGFRYPIHEVPFASAVFGTLGIKYWINPHTLQYDHQSGYQWQIEHVFSMQILPDCFERRMYLSGFADHAIDNSSGTDTTWVEEAQLGIRLFDEMYFIAEQRYNGFRRAQRNSVGIGLEYRYKFQE